MRTIEATALIADDRRLVLQLPPDVAPGEHHVRVTIDEPAQVLDKREAEQETPTRRDGNVLVYNGTVEGPIGDPVQEVREERIQQLITQAVQ